MCSNKFSHADNPAGELSDPDDRIGLARDKPLFQGDLERAFSDDKNIISLFLGRDIADYQVCL